MKSLMVSRSTDILFYDAEYDLGLTPWDQSAADENQTILNNFFAAMKYDGSFDWQHGPDGRVDRNLFIPGKTYYVRPPIKLPIRIGCCVWGTGGTGYEMLNGEFGTGGTYGGMKSRIVGLNSSGQTKAVFRVRGNGTEIRGLDIYGRVKDAWSDAGDRAVACVQVEGGAAPNNPGRLTLINCGLYDAQYGIQTKSGYYDGSEVFQSDENHADLGYVANCEVFNCESAFRSENQQSVGWQFQKITVENAGTVVPTENIVFDIYRGGCVNASGVIVNCTKSVLIQISEYSPNNNSFDITGLFRDRSSSVGTQDYLTLVKYVGSTEYPAPGVPWRVRISGHFADPDITRYNAGRFMQCEQPDIDTSNMLFDINHLPTTEFSQVDSSPWYQWQANVGDTRARYQFNETSGSTAYECFGRGVNGTISGAVYTTDKDGNATRALDFANTTDYVNFADDTSLRAYTTSTVAFWVKLDSYINGSVLSKVGTYLSGFRTESSGTKFYLTEGGVDKADLHTYVTTGAWHHICLTLDGSGSPAYVCYVDGTSRSTGTMTGGAWLGEAIALRIGKPSSAFYGSGSTSADMKFDDLRIYDRVLSAGEVAALYAM